MNLLNKQFGIKCKVFPNIIDEDILIDINKKNKVVDEFVFLNVASLDKNKNHELLIRAFAKNFRGTKAKLKIVGSGKLLIRLKYLCEQLKIIDQVFFLGLLGRKQVMYEMKNADCFVLSSNYETFGVVLIEALSLGTPVISTNCGGPIDIVNKRNGILVSPENIDELAQAMEYIYCNINSFDTKTIQLDTINNFGKDFFIKEIKKIYN